MIAIGLNSRIPGTDGDHHFFLCDYDGETLHDITLELYNLGVRTYDVVRTGKGYHVYSFNPVRTWPTYARLLYDSDLACPDFVDCTNKRKYGTLRIWPRDDLTLVNSRGYNNPPKLHRMEFCAYERPEQKTLEEVTVCVKA